MLRVFDPKKSEDGLRLNCDLLEEVRDSTHLKIAKYQDKVSKYCNSKSKKQGFSLNDLVLRESAISIPSKLNKLSPPWEGPYRVIKVIKPGTYRLAHLDGSPLQNTWNAIHLRKYYPGTRSKSPTLKERKIFHSAS